MRAIEDDEIDLRPYLAEIVRRLPLIAGISLLAALITALVLFAWGQMQVPEYKGEASVAIVGMVSDVSFEPRFTTTSDDPTGGGSGSAVLTRRNALLALAKSGAIAEAVMQRLGPRLTTEGVTPAHLLQQIDAELPVTSGRSGDSDLIRITALADTPEQAALLATTWAEEYVRYTNSIFGQVPDDLLAAIQNEAVQAQNEYHRTQAALEQFIATSRHDELQRQVAAKEQTIASLQGAQNAAIDDLVNTVILGNQTVISATIAAETDSRLLALKAGQASQQQLLDAYVDALGDGPVLVFQQQAERHQKALQGAFALQRHLEVVLGDTVALQRQVEAGGDSAARSSVTAIQLLKLKAFGALMPADVGPDQEIQPLFTTFTVETGTSPDLSAAEVLADLDALVMTIEQRLSEVENEIGVLSDRLLNGDQYSYLDRNIPETSALVEAARVRYPELLAPGYLVELLPSRGELNEAELLLGLSGLNQQILLAPEESLLQPTIMNMEREVTQLKSELEAATAQYLELTEERNLARETLRTLNNKVAELHLTRVASSSAVRFAAPAVLPATPVSGPGLVLPVLMAMLLAFALAVFVLLVMQYLHASEGRSAYSQPMPEGVGD
jgi:uncharacterized protein involved in exopolysaccharide biosynthesis